MAGLLTKTFMFGALATGTFALGGRATNVTPCGDAVVRNAEGRASSPLKQSTIEDWLELEAKESADRPVVKGGCPADTVEVQRSALEKAGIAVLNAVALGQFSNELWAQSTGERIAKCGPIAGPAIPR